MYGVIRKIHLYTAMVLAVFITMYFFTGYVIIHSQWFPNSQTTTVRTEPLPAGAETSPQARAVYLQDTFNLSGRRRPPQHLRDGRWVYRYERPSVRYTAVVSAAGDSVRIATTSTKAGSKSGNNVAAR